MERFFNRKLSHVPSAGLWRERAARGDPGTDLTGNTNEYLDMGKSGVS
jgi:hypothetical protein